MSREKKKGWPASKLIDEINFDDSWRRVGRRPAVRFAASEPVTAMGCFCCRGKLADGLRGTTCTSSLPSCCHASETLALTLGRRTSLTLNLRWRLPPAPRLPPPCPRLDLAQRFRHRNDPRGNGTFAPNAGVLSFRVFIHHRMLYMLTLHALMPSLSGSVPPASCRHPRLP